MYRFVFAFLLAGLLILEPTAALAAPEGQNHGPVGLIGDIEIELTGPEGFIRVDGLDQDIDSILAAFQPESCQTLAIYAQPEAWDKFYEEVYGQKPRDLAYFAVISSPDIFMAENLSLLNPEMIHETFSSVVRFEGGEVARPNRRGPAAILESGALTVTPFELIEGAETYVSFKTRLGLLQNDEDGQDLFREHYLLTVSAVLIRGKMVLLSLYSSTRNEPTTETEDLALAWRDANLKISRESSAPSAGEDRQGPENGLSR